MTLLDDFLAHDPDGVLHAQVAAFNADEARGITWGVYRGDTLLGTTDAYFRAEFMAADEADAAGLPRTHFRIEAVGVPAVAA